MSRRLIARVPLVLLLAFSSCASPTGPRLLRTPDDSVRPVAHVDAIRTYDVAVASISSVLERDFKLPPFPVVFYFFPDRRAFQDGLLEAGYSESLARDTAERMSAVGGYRRVLLNEPAIDRQNWPSRVASLAHELAHSVQYELGGGHRGVSDQWLREGFAEWLSLRVMDRLRGISYSEARRRYAMQFWRTDRALAPALAEMVTFPQWVEVNGRRGVVPYAQAFLAVDFLVERHGVAAVFGYFRRFARSQDRVANFRASFGEDLEAFEAALRGQISNSHLFLRLTPWPTQERPHFRGRDSGTGGSRVADPEKRVH